MRYNIPVFAILAIVILAIGVGAYRHGLPGNGVAVGVPFPSSLPPAEPAVTGFGPVPHCGDREALETVMGMLRNRLSLTQTGLANITEVRRGITERGYEMLCNADVETSSGQTAVSYIVLTLAGKANWRITLNHS